MTLTDCMAIAFIVCDMKMKPLWMRKKLQDQLQSYFIWSLFGTGQWHFIQMVSSDDQDDRMPIYIRL